MYYERVTRLAGVSKYPLRKMLAKAADGVTSFTAWPLRLIAVLGIAISMLSVAMVL